MKLLLFGEGRDDVGRDERHEGVVGTLVRRVIEPDGVGLDLDVVSLISLPKDPTNPRSSRLARVVKEAKLRDADGLIFVRDADGEPERERRKLDAEAAACSDPVVVGLAIQTIEAWLLADRDAVKTVLGYTGTLPGSPEALWGARGAAGHPKYEWEQLCRNLKVASHSGTKAAIADAASIATLRTTCPLGFGAFHDALIETFPAFDIVVAVDRRWGIGLGGDLPWPRLKNDFAHFKRITSEGKAPAIIMGRKTWESIGSKPLPRRLNIVVSSNALELPAGVKLASSLSRGLAAARGCSNVSVVGGARLYNEAIHHPRFRYAYVTRVDTVAECDTHIEDLDACLEHDVSWEISHFEEAGLEYAIERLRRPPRT